MGQHFTRNTVSASAYCPKCAKQTQHKVTDRRIAHCLDCQARLEEQHKREAALPKQESLFGGAALMHTVDGMGCKSVHLIVPMVPPSVNRYVRHTRGGGHYVDEAAKAFKFTLASIARQSRIVAKAYEIEAHVYQGKGGRTDCDNFGKVICDALQAAGVIQTDSRVTDLIIRKRRDRLHPRTEITVRAL